ncbi:MAG: peptidylprolyl isomerase [Elusimicrobia bacterium]|nr:peptidylprolyl isomerase [Elusimicrobiota bacterium]MDY6040164.1 peptidylprolyl isomerase [Elusimicrobiaceae bacterium]
MKKGFIIFLLMLAAWGCTKPQTEETTAPEVAVRVGVVTVSQEEVEERLRLLSAEDRKFAQTPMGRQNLLNIIAREKLIALAAKEEKLDESDVYLALMEDKRAQLDEIYEEYAAQTLEQMWYDKLKENGQLEVTDKEIDDYYKKYPYEMTVRQIILDNAQTADQVLRTLKASPSKWNTMSKQYSVAPEVIRSDKFSFMPGEFIPSLEVIAATSANGSVQGFIKTPQGFHIIMKTGEKRLSRKEAEPRIRTVLENKKLDAVLEALQNKYEVVIYDKNE